MNETAPRRPGRGMHWREILGEARRDLASGTTRALLLSTVFGGVTVLAVALALADTVRAIDAAAEYRAIGASVNLIRAENRIDGAACDSLGDLPGVRSAGSLRKAADDLAPALLPSTPIPTKEVSPGFLAVVGSTPWNSPTGLAVSRGVVEATGLREGDPLPLQTREAAIAATFEYPDDGRQGDLAYSALVPQPRDDPLPYDECWIDVWPEDPQLTGLLRTTVLPPRSDEDDRPTTLQLNGRLGQRFAGSDAVTDGSGRSVAWGALGGGLLLGFVSVRLRRLELASAQHAGVSRPAQVATQLTQGLVWIIAGSVFASPAVATLALGDNPADTPVLLVTALRPMAVAALGAVGGIVAATIATRQKHLFRYFTNR